MMIPSHHNVPALPGFVQVNDGPMGLLARDERIVPP
jgi:hypothetical protein